MLRNQNGQVVKISDKLNSRSNPNVFMHLREDKIPSNHSEGKMFSLEARVKFKQ